MNARPRLHAPRCRGRAVRARPIVPSATRRSAPFGRSGRGGVGWSLSLPPNAAPPRSLSARSVPPAGPGAVRGRPSRGCRLRASLWASFLGVRRGSFSCVRCVVCRVCVGGARRAARRVVVAGAFVARLARRGRVGVAVGRVVGGAALGVAVASLGVVGVLRVVSGARGGSRAARVAAGSSPRVRRAALPASPGGKKRRLWAHCHGSITLAAVIVTGVECAATGAEILMAEDAPNQRWETGAFILLSRPV